MSIVERASLLSGHEKESERCSYSNYDSFNFWSEGVDFTVTLANNSFLRVPGNIGCGEKILDYEIDQVVLPILNVYQTQNLPALFIQLILLHLIQLRVLTSLMSGHR